MSAIGPLTLYVNPAWRRTGLHAPFLYPFWGNPNPVSSLFAKEMFDSFSFDTSLYTVTSDLARADMVFAPYRHVWLRENDPALLEECIATSKKTGLPLLIDGMGDVEYPITYEHAYVLRIGGYRFLKERNRIQVPPASDDLLLRCRNGGLLIRPKRDGVPAVGFAAWIAYSRARRARTVLKELPIRFRALFNERYHACEKGIFWRQRAVASLQASDRVALSLRARTSFSGSTKTAEGDLRRLREELVETVIASDYALDVRGDANEATRLYEILSLGRIPVILDTERNFPFSDVVDYRSFALMVDFRDIKRLPDILADFHARVDPEEYEAMQRRARDAFIRYFRIDAQMAHIVRELRARLAARP